mmetsp:Transcript_88798/g.177578  ORF Transcript_88798/g.177578 Transcript_88798/m.177578 type:complete len:95 (+) Transcript_88798:111-395(+)
MSFRRTIQTFARYDVNPHLVKLWKAHKPTDGQVVRQMSPFEQNVIGAFFKSYPAEFVKNAKEAAFNILPAFVALFCIKGWAEWKFHDIAHQHRD